MKGELPPRGLEAVTRDDGESASGQPLRHQPEQGGVVVHQQNLPAVRHLFFHSIAPFRRIRRLIRTGRDLEHRSSTPFIVRRLNATRLPFGMMLDDIRVAVAIFFGSITCSWWRCQPHPLDSTPYTVRAFPAKRLTTT